MTNIEDVVEYSKDLKLLYVEDNRDARDMTMMALEDFFDTIEVAVDGEDGYEKFKKGDIDIIITDINMPKLNGMEMCKKIRDIDTSVPIIVLSAHNEDDFFIESIKLGVNGYLLKPMDMDQLINLLATLTQKYKYEKEAKENLNLLKTYEKAINQSSIVSKTDTRGIITFINDNFCKISEYTRDELIGKNHNIVRHPDNPKSIFKDMWHTIKIKKEIWRGLVRNMAKSGKSYYVDALVMPILDLEGNVMEYISLRNDITDIMNPLKQLNDEIYNSDDLVLIYLKLDNFGDIEEIYSHENIKLFKDKILDCLEEEFKKLYEFDKIYSLENHEYAFVLKSSVYMQDKKEFLKRLIDIQSNINEKTIATLQGEYNISILVSISHKKEKILESVKLGIKKLLSGERDFILANNLAFLKHKKHQKNMKVVSMIKSAIEEFRIVSHFQPIVDNSTREICKYESLVRLIDEDGKVLSPFFFLDIAKKSNFYLNITDAVLKNSFCMLKGTNFDISINLSAIDIEKRGMREKIFEYLDNNRQNCARIVFELLEDEAIKNFSVVKKFISKVKEYGVKIAIDDFGTGYSNFERLLDFQPDILKIDGSLIKNLETSTYSLSAVKSIAIFAKEQGLQTVAEFIENEKIYNIVKELGIDFSQGYYFGKPKPLNKGEVE